MSADHPMQDPDDEELSLFGSPPPSPGRVTPVQLALPGSNQNVGTIALPGSHTYSELSVRLPASSLSNTQSFLEPTLRASSSSMPLFLPSPSRQPVQAARQASRRRPIDAPAAISRRPPPAITIPAPNGPPPPNFLRSQNALLGHAGLVAGLHPTQLPQPHTRGQSRQNPIIVDPDHEQPRIGRRPPKNTGSRAPVLTQEQVLASFVKNKEAVSVLASILNLVTQRNGSAVGPGEDPNAQSSEDASILNGAASLGSDTQLRAIYAPAGTSGWDVPFPFRDGQEPPQYRSQWNLDTTKRLVGRLISLIQDAARDAGDEESRKHNPGYYRPVTATYGPQAASQPQGPVTTGSQSPSCAIIPKDGVDTNFFHDNLPLFDDLMASLDLSGMMAPTTGTFDADLDLLQQSSSGTPFTGDQGQAGTSDSDLNMEELMALLQSFPVPETFSAEGMNIGATSNSPGDGRQSGGMGFLEANQPSNSKAMDSSNLAEDFVIDPVLLAMTMPDTIPAQDTTGELPPPSSFGSFPTSSASSTTFAISPTPGLMPSPLASTSSLADPSTPRWDFYPEPEIASADQDGPNDDNARTAFQFPPFEQSSGPFPLPALRPFSPCVPAAQIHPHPAFPKPTSTSTIRPVPPGTLPFPLTPTPIASTPTPGPSCAPPKALAPGGRRRDVAGPGRPVVPKSKTRAEVMRRARERRRQLEAELERAKVELWETTLEQGVLANLIKNGQARPGPT